MTVSLQEKEIRTHTQREDVHIEKRQPSTNQGGGPGISFCHGPRKESDDTLGSDF